MKMSMEQWWNDTDREKHKSWRKSCPTATLSTNTVTSGGTGSNLGLHSNRPANNHLSYGILKIKMNLNV